MFKCNKNERQYIYQLNLYIELNTNKWLEMHCKYILPMCIRQCVWEKLFRIKGSTFHCIINEYENYEERVMIY